MPFISVHSRMPDRPRLKRRSWIPVPSSQFPVPAKFRRQGVFLLFANAFCVLDEKLMITAMN
jgi:hypothetical protein